MYRTLITVDYLVDRLPSPWDSTRVLKRAKQVLALIEEPLGYSRFLAIKRLAETDTFRVQAQVFVATEDVVDLNPDQESGFPDVAILMEVFSEAEIEEALGYLESGLMDRYRTWSAREKRRARGRRKWTARAGCDRKPRRKRK